MPPVSRITLIGVGLIGGSFVLDLKRQQPALTVTGIDTDPANLERALERRVIDRAFAHISAPSVRGADLVLLATPVATLGAVCQALAPLLDADTTVSDVGSTKRSALTAFAQHLPQQLPRCVAAHPIAGSDRSGAAAARFGLFQNKKLVLCPHEQQDPGSLKTVETLWQAVGAQTCRMSAAEHDAVFAAVSHLPHLLAFAYVHQLLDDARRDRYFRFAGSGFRDFTRIAASHPQMWTDIALENRKPLLDLIARQQTQLATLQQALADNNAAALHDFFAAAAAARRKWEEESG